jgi:hypothetical protein
MQMITNLIRIRPRGNFGRSVVRMEHKNKNNCPVLLN